MRSLYQTVSSTDPLKFWAGPGASMDYPSVARFLDLDKNALSKIGGVSETSVRLDQKIPRQLAERLQQIANICTKVANHFEGDTQKAALWFRTQNPMLGYVTPRDMIRLGRYDRLLRFVLEAEEENAPA
ncbi:antitoxin Xre/MbcA/ParS toxin-binding domain-containing protein [Salinisphaera sp.]|uniref:antitoxin Xre/MbcA/ParS toxin-binding domain-containing protein n=1 Tax=Salinisphaera sp. TaxID=1914330 RepID=UPI002D77800A|nr:hypothetical protein [Salinisphaera sp.]